MSPINIKTETSTKVTINGIEIDNVIEELSVYRQRNNLDSDTFYCEGDACAFLDLIGD